jgi:hypothetical protein
MFFCRHAFFCEGTVFSSAIFAQKFSGALRRLAQSQYAVLS